MTKVEQLEEILNEIDPIIQHSLYASVFQVWKLKTAHFIETQFGSASIPYEQFKKTYFDTHHYDPISAYKRELEITKEFLSAYLRELKSEPPVSSTIPELEKPPHNFKKVFIVHGHDIGLREAVRRLLENQDIEAVILQERVNGGATIIEKFEAHSDVDAAICLFTADDIGTSVNSKEYAKRARQNVVFEAGFFIGKLGRERVIIIKDSDIEIPSDLDGIVSAKSSNWEIKVLQELESIGYSIDYNIAFSKNR